MEGKALLNFFRNNEYENINNLTHPEPNLREYNSTKKYFEALKPEYVFLFAGRSGGIKANQEMPATLMTDNLRVISNVLSAAYEFEVDKLLYLASSCIYPKYAEQPMHPDMIMTGVLEPTNSSYATAKLAGIELCKAYQLEHRKNFISAIPANIFGPGDNFNSGNSHVVAALITKMHQAKLNNDRRVKIWGTGTPRREFIFVEDLVDACVLLMELYNENQPVNIGSGIALSIADLAETIKKVTAYEGHIEFDNTKPDGMPEKILDSNYLFSLGWGSLIPFEIAIKKTYRSFISQKST